MTTLNVQDSHFRDLFDDLYNIYEIIGSKDILSIHHYVFKVDRILHLCGYKDLIYFYSQFRYLKKFFSYDNSSIVGWNAVSFFVGNMYDSIEKRIDEMENSEGFHEE